MAITVRAVAGGCLFVLAAAAAAPSRAEEPADTSAAGSAPATRSETLFRLWDACQGGSSLHCDRYALAKQEDGDFTTARKVWSDMCSKGRARSCYNLGVLERKSGGGDEAAQGPWEKACRMKFMVACDALNTLEIEEKPAAPEDKKVIDVRAAEAEPTTVRWLGFEANLNFVFQSIQAYSGAGGLAYAPVIRSVFQDLDLVPHVSVQLARTRSGSIFPMIQAGASGHFHVSDAVYAGVAAGAGISLTPDRSQRFPYFGVEGGWRPGLEGLPFLDRVFLRYDLLLTEEITHEFLLGAGIAF